MSYALSLMRSHHDEHSDSLPVIDITALKHSAYVFDALIYYMRTAPEPSDVDNLRDGVSSVTSWQDEEAEEEHEEELPGGATSSSVPGVQMDTESVDGESDGATRLGRRHPFFQRSDSTIFMGCPPPDPFHTPLVEALPLADQPHLLQPNARREEYFGLAKSTVVSKTGEGGTVPVGQQLPLSLALSLKEDEERARLAMSLRNASFQPISTAPSGSTTSRGRDSMSGTSQTGNLLTLSTVAQSGSIAATGAPSAFPLSDLRPSSDIFPQSVAVNLSMSSHDAVLPTTTSSVATLNPLNIPLPLENHPLNPSLSGAVLYPESASSVIVVSSSSLLPSSSSTTSSTMVYSFPLPHLSFPMVANPQPHQTADQLARGALSAFSEIATSRERMVTSVSTANTTTVSTSLHPAAAFTTSASPSSFPSSSSSSSQNQAQLGTIVTTLAHPASDPTQPSVIVHTPPVPRNMFPQAAQPPLPPPRPPLH